MDDAVSEIIAEYAAKIDAQERIVQAEAAAVEVAERWESIYSAPFDPESASSCKGHAEFEDENGEADSNKWKEIPPIVYQVKTYVTERSKENPVLTDRSKLH